MVKVKVDDSSMREPVLESCVHDTNMDIIDPTETRRMRSRTVMTRGSNAYESTARARTKYCVDGFTNSPEGAFHSIERFRAEVQVPFMKVLGRLVSPPIHLGSLEFLSTQCKLRFGRLTHCLQLFHPSRSMHIDYGW
ncbi:hypothetical protein HG531_006959 [Fusarium graminearum]|nr:hypothetical protein HG531_006959 [Fusarium graminearum]